MNVAVHLLGDPGRMPFVGHFRAHIKTDAATLAAAGRVAAQDGIVSGFQAARIVEGALHGIRTAGVIDRHDLLRRAWTALFDMAACDLGPSAGADFSVLFACRDGEGMGIAGIGLGGVWGTKGAELEPLVEGSHPLLGEAGVPTTAPGVLTLDAPLDAVFAVPTHLQPVLPSRDALLARCGMHP